MSRAAYTSSPTDRISATNIPHQDGGPDRQHDEESAYPGSSHTQRGPQLCLARRLEYDGERELHGNLRWRIGMASAWRGGRHAKRNAKPEKRHVEAHKRHAGVMWTSQF